MPHPQGGESLAEDIQNLKSQGIEILVSMLTHEEQLALKLENEQRACEDAGISFFNFPIKDEVPNSISETLEFINSLDQHSNEETKIAFHCRGGVGRSSMMLSLLAAKKGVSPEESFKLISDQRGENAPESDVQKQWITSIVKKHITP